MLSYVKFNCVFQPCTTRFNLVWLFLRRTMSTQHWSRVETSLANTSTDGECDRNVRFEIVVWSGTNVQELWCEAWTNVQLFCSRSRQALARVWKELWVRILVETWVLWPIELCDVSSGRVAGIFFSARVNWCSCASVVIFSNSVVINSLSSFSVPFSVISMLQSARCMSLLSVGVVE